MHGTAGEREALAAEWVAREDRGALTEAQVEALQAWLAADRRNHGAYVRARVVFAHSGRARALATSPAPAPVPARRSVRWRHWVGGMAAALCLLLGAMVLLPPAAQVHATRKGEILRVPLADGSAMTLDSDSQVRVQYGRQRREIALQRGEALFDVAADSRRPFVVRAGQMTVSAVGTSFSVSRGSAGVDVLVREGVVDVADVEGQMAPTRLQANSRARATSEHGIRIEPVDAQDVVRQLAWREGMLSFNGDTLSTAVAQFRRYSDTPILIDDPRVGSRRIVGLYSASDPHGFARSAAISLGLVAEIRGQAIHLRLPSDLPQSGQDRLH